MLVTQPTTSLKWPLYGTWGVHKMTVDYGNNHNTDSKNSVSSKNFICIWRLIFISVDYVDLGFEKWSLPKNLQI